MRVTSSAMTWLLDFLNFDAESDRHGSLETVMPLKQRWSRHLCFIVEPKPLAASLAESLQVAIWVNENLIKSHQDKIDELGGDPQQTQRSAVLEDEIAQYQKNKDYMQSFLRLDEKKLSKQAQEIRKALKGAVFMTSAEALEKLVQELTVWSLGKNVNPVWKLRRLEKHGRYTEPGQGVLSVGGGKFAVDCQLTQRRGLEDAIHSNVAKCLETGELDRLRRCQWEECRRFFFAQHFRKTHCCPEHQRNRDNKKNAASRVQKSRAKQAKKEKDTGLPKLVTIGKELPRLMKSADHELEPIRKLFGEQFEDLIFHAARIKKGENPDRVWRTLPRRMKKRFVAMAAIDRRALARAE